MKGYLTSYSGLFQARSAQEPHVVSVEIPLIQRDYAQGRAEPSVEEIRTSFLEVLLGAVAGGPPVGLDFVYGKIEEGTLLPLDGQQRLTTLFLLHWYLASAAGQLDQEADWTRFSYATRPSARLFCQRLVTNPLPREISRPSEWITDQPWYLHVWRNDPTVQAMLVMIDAINDGIRRLYPHLDAQQAWHRLSDEGSPAISFHLLPLGDMDSGEDLYIKMNSRGKPLTPFESFKARFEQDIAHSHRVSEFAHKVDGAWSDLLWPIHGGDYIVDDEFYRYVDFITEICELRENRTESGRLTTRARAIFGVDNPRAGEHLDFLFAAFDCWLDQAHVVATFDRYLTIAMPGQDSYDSEKVVLFGVAGTNLLAQCCHLFDSQAIGNRDFTLQQSLLLYAMLLHQIQQTENFRPRLRMLRNLIAASENEIRRPNMPRLISDVEAVIVDGDLNAVSVLNSNQVDDEQRKVQFIQGYPGLTDALCRLEDHPLLRGSLGAFELDAETLRARAEAFEAVFADPRNWSRLTGALLATGDYQRRRTRSAAWQFGTGSERNDTAWRYLLTNESWAGLAATRTVLSALLDGLAASEQSPEAHLDQVMSSWLAERQASARYDWRYYLVRYDSMREGATGIYYGADGQLGYSMCMLRTQQLNGHYRDPILLEIWRSSQTENAVDDPWFTGFDTNPRWLRLSRSGAGLRSVAKGFALERPIEEAFAAVFDAVCADRDDIVADGQGLLLKVPQQDRDGELIDSVDRTQLGAIFVKHLVDAGL